MAARPHGRHLAHGDGQARSSRLGLGLTAPAPHHQPRGLLHPRVRKRLDFGCADNLFVPGFIFDFKVAQGACAFAHAACIPCCARSFARAPAPGLLPAFLYFVDARAAGWEAAGCRFASLSGARSCFCLAVNSEGRCVRSKLRVRGSARRGLSSGNSNVADTTVWSVIF